MVDTNRDFLNRVNPGSYQLGLKAIALGSLMAGQFVQTARQINTVGMTGMNCLATLNEYIGAASAGFIHRAYARAGAVTGELVVVAYGTTPASGQIAVAPNGSIVTLLTNALTDLDVVFTPERGDVLEFVLPVLSNSLSLAGVTGASTLLSVTALAGVSLGSKVVLIPGAAPAAGQTSLNVAKTAVAFAAADAVTRARVRLLVKSAADLTSFLTATDGIYQ